MRPQTRESHLSKKEDGPVTLCSKPRRSINIVFAVIFVIVNIDQVCQCFFHSGYHHPIGVPWNYLERSGPRHNSRVEVLSVCSLQKDFQSGTG